MVTLIMSMPTPVNWIGGEDKLSRFLSQTLGFESKVTGDLLTVITMIANLPVSESQKDNMVARIELEDGQYRTELNWRDYK